MFLKKHLLQLFKHPLISGSVVIVIGALCGNVFNFGYNLFMSRNLSIADYGTFASLISLITMATLPAGALMPTVVGFAAKHFANNELDMIHGLYYRVEKFVILISILIFITFLLFSSAIGGFFNIHDVPSIILVGITVVIGFNSTVNVALLQAKLKFGFISIINFFGALLKFLLGMLFVMLGYGVGGAMLAFVISYLLPFLLSFFPLKFLFSAKNSNPKINNKELLSFGVPAAIALFGLTSLITTDIILVKHFMNAKNAGLYAGLSLIGRIIFFLSAPIGTVMFPLIAQKHAREEKYMNTLLLAIFLVVTPSLCFSAFYFIFPELAIQFFLKKKEYFVLAPYLGIFSIFITIYSVLTILTNFYLAIKKTWIWAPIVTITLLQILLISFYHQTFMQIITISLGLASLLLLLLVLYYMKLYAQEKRQ